MQELMALLPNIALMMLNRGAKYIDDRTTGNKAIA